jgi:erythromycin esterase-like protein
MRLAGAEQDVIYGDDARLIGFTMYSGTVSAASNWDEPK